MSLLTHIFKDLGVSWKLKTILQYRHHMLVLYYICYDEDKQLMPKSIFVAVELYANIRNKLIMCDYFLPNALAKLLYMTWERQ